LVQIIPPYTVRMAKEVTHMLVSLSGRICTATYYPV